MFVAKDISVVGQEELCLLLYLSNFAGCNEFTASPPEIFSQRI